MPTVKTVITPVRLFDRYPDTGFRFLAYPAGEEVPVAEYRRLTNSAKKKRPKQKPVVASYEPEPEPDDTGLEKMTKAQLLVEAKQRGLRVSVRSRVDELREIVRKAREDAP